jgi:hypothetical protein
MPLGVGQLTVGGEAVLSKSLLQRDHDRRGVAAKRACTVTFPIRVLHQQAASSVETPRVTGAGPAFDLLVQSGVSVQGYRFETKRCAITEFNAEGKILRRNTRRRDTSM